jgi:1,6-anhydro-N-acetylmuramate kinase
MKSKAAILPPLAVLAVVSMSAVRAHDVAKGPNGGPVAEAPPHHVELVVKDQTVTVFVTDATDKPLPVTGFKGVAILTVGGKAQRIVLAPQDGSRLTGTSPVAVPAPAKGVVQLTGPDGKTAQARFQ